MSNDFDCNINGLQVNKIQTSRKEKKPEAKKEANQEYKEGSSLDLQPTAVAGRSMIDVKLCNLKKIMTREEFEKLASQKMQKTLIYTASRDFIPELLVQIKPEEQEDFLNWVDFCNKYAETASQIYDNSEQDNDRWAVVKNFQSFVENPVLKTNLDDCIKLIETYKNNEKDVNDINISHLILRCIKNKTPDDVLNHLKAIDVLKENFVERNRTEEKASLSALSTTTPADILRLEPIAKKLKLDMSIPQYLSYMRNNYGLEVKDEDIQRTADAIDGINENSKNIGYMRKIINEMIFLNDEKFNEHNKWLHYINDNIDVDLKNLPCIEDMIDIILFKDKKEYAEMYGKKYAEMLKDFEKLIKNTEIIDAVRNAEIDITKGLYFFDKSRYDDVADIADIMEQIKSFPDAQIIEAILDSRDGVLNILANNSKAELFDKLTKIEKMKQKTQANPKLYVNGNDTNPRMIKAKIQDFYDINSVELVKLVSALDKEAIDVLMRKRLDDFEEYMSTIKDFSTEEMELLKDLSASVNIDEKPFLPTQKAEFIDLIEGYKNNNLDMTELIKASKTGKIDLAKFKIDLFNQIMKNAGLSDEEIAQTPKERLVMWDTKYAHLLAKGYTEVDEYEEVDETGYNDILRAANLYDFKEYIHDETNVYGKANANTKQMFKDMNMNYEKWVYPSQTNEIDFVSHDKNEEQLQQIIAQITEDMNTFMSTPVKGHIKKQFPEFVKGDKFVIPDEYTKSKAKTLELVESLVNMSDTGKMAPVWKRAIKNLKEGSPDKKEMAKRTETVYQHLHQRIDDLKNVSDVKIEKNLNWKIKMWDRVPQKDLFQGNYSTCCIGIGKGNGHAMPHYLMNTAYNMIEIVDNENGKTVGNALCYFVKTDNGKPAFVLDNVEINTSEKPSDETGKDLREKIFEYASKVAKDVTGQDDVPVFLSDQYNDIPFEDLPSRDEKISFLGDIDCENIYMDMFSKPAQWTSRDDLTQSCKVLTLK